MEYIILTALLLLSVPATLAVSFLIAVCVYIKSNSSIGKKLYHDKLGRHKCSSEVALSGTLVKSTCEVCGKEIILDSQGNWNSIYTGGDEDESS